MKKSKSTILLFLVEAQKVLSQKKIIGYLLEHDRITNREVQQLLEVKDSRALKIIKEMVEDGVLSKQGKLKSSYYTLKK